MSPQRYPQIKCEVKKQERGDVSSNLREVNLKTEEFSQYRSYHNIKAEFFNHSPRICPHISSSLVIRTSRNRLHHIIPNEQSSVAIFFVCLGVGISKLALLPPAAAGSLFLHLLMSIFCRQQKKDVKGGRMMALTESPRG